MTKINRNSKLQHLVNMADEPELAHQAVTVFAWSSKRYAVLRYPDGRWCFPSWRILDALHPALLSAGLTGSSVCAQSLICVQLFVTLMTVAHQAPLSMEFSRQEYWSGVPLPTPGDLLDPGIEPESLVSSAVVGINHLVIRKKLIIEDSLPIPPYTQHHLLWMKTGLWCGWWWFISLAEWSLPLHIILQYLLFIACHNLF